jgi:hypothetical protein
MAFSQLLLGARQSDPAIPLTPIKVHLLLRMYQVHSTLGPEMACGVDILIQDTDILAESCLACCEDFVNDGSMEILDKDAYRLTPEGASRAKIVDQFRKGVRDNF